jgi:hypothetical protein
MRLSAAIRKDTGVYPGDGVTGKERPTWYAVSTLKVQTGGIDVADVGQIPANSLRIRVPNGKYAIEAKHVDFCEKCSASFETGTGILPVPRLC